MPAVVDVGSKAGQRMVDDPERGLLGILKAACRFDESLESADYVERHRGIAERRKNHTVASSVQQTEDCVGTGTLSMDWWSVASGKPVDMNGCHNSGIYSPGGHLPCAPCQEPMLTLSGPYRWTERNIDRTPSHVVGRDRFLSVMVVCLDSYLSTVS